MKNQKGQVLLILILVMTVALAIGISVVQRSLSDISTASKIEQSSRAFSAAEAGIEKAIQEVAQGNYSAVSSFNLDNNAVVQGVDKNAIPTTGQALEYLPLAKEEMAQVWLANPSDLSSAYTGCTTPTNCTLDIYWGNVGVTSSDEPAIEITIVYQNTANEFKSKKYFLDRNAASRQNNFDSSSITCPSNSITTSLSSSTAKSFFCKKTIDVSSSVLTNLSKLILLRARLLYSDTSQSFAVRPTSGSLPIQARIFTSTGTSGGTQRKVQVFRLDKVVPSYFDYAIFSAGEISK